MDEHCRFFYFSDRFEEVTGVPPKMFLGKTQEETGIPVDPMAWQEHLDNLAARLKSDNRNVFLEIEGHTDSSGPEGYNLVLGQRRAEAVRRYLNGNHSIPLHRMSVITYGESRPSAD